MSDKPEPTMNDAAKAMFQALVFEQLSETTKEDLLKHALDMLTHKAGYGAKETYLEKAFKGALDEHVNALIDKAIEEDDRLTKVISDLLREAIEKFFDEKMVERIRKAFAENLKSTFRSVSW